MSGREPFRDDRGSREREREVRNSNDDMRRMLREELSDYAASQGSQPLPAPSGYPSRLLPNFTPPLPAGPPPVPAAAPVAPGTKHCFNCFKSWGIIALDHIFPQCPQPVRRQDGTLGPPPNTQPPRNSRLQNVQFSTHAASSSASHMDPELQAAIEAVTKEHHLRKEAAAEAEKYKLLVGALASQGYLPPSAIPTTVPTTVPSSPSSISTHTGTTGTALVATSEASFLAEIKETLKHLAAAITSTQSQLLKVQQVQHVQLQAPHDAATAADAANTIVFDSPPAAASETRQRADIKRKFEFMCGKRLNPTPAQQTAYTKKLKQHLTLLNIPYPGNPEDAVDAYIDAMMAPAHHSA